MPPSLVRKQVTQAHVPMIDERCGDAVGVGVLVVTRANTIVIELKNLHPWQSEQYRRMGDDDELRSLNHKRTVLVVPLTLRLAALAVLVPWVLSWSSALSMRSPSPA